MPSQHTAEPADGVLEERDGRAVLRFERHLAHPVDRVWTALTDPGELAGWWGEADVELVEGGRFTITWLNEGPNGERVVMPATITRLDPPHLLEMEGEPHGRLRWELRPRGAGTTLRFSSTLDLPDKYRALTLAGWHHHLDALAELLAGRRLELRELPNERFDRIHGEYEARLRGGDGLPGAR
jgi:uncharacterized protein YndB with AHSA1/START domain